MIIAYDVNKQLIWLTFSIIRKDSNSGQPGSKINFQGSEHAFFRRFCVKYFSKIFHGHLECKIVRSQIASAWFLAMLIGSALTIGPNVYIRGTKESNRGHPPQSWSVRPPRPNWYVWLGMTISLLHKHRWTGGEFRRFSTGMYDRRGNFTQRQF